jgi:peroxisomal 2,4-dienoyl-CoA reductase
MEYFKENLFKDKVMLLTGGTSKMLYQAAHDFMKLGGNVALVSRKKEELEKIANDLISKTGGKAKGYVLDLKKAVDKDYEALIDDILSDFKRIDILVNGAAGNFLAEAEHLSLNGFKTVIEIDTIGTFQMCKHVYRKWMNKNGGNIINISATLHYLGTLMNVHASTAKAGVDAITKTLALEWGPKGVRVNGVAPGFIEGTEGFDRLIDIKVEKKVEKDDIKGLIPLQRFGNRKDVSNTILYLASDLSSYVNGQTIVVDGHVLGIFPNWLQMFPEFVRKWRAKF